MPGAVGGWMQAVQAAAAVGGKKLPLDVLLHAAIGHARDGYTITKSQAGLTKDKLGELKNELQGELMLPVSELNRLRRDVATELERQRALPKRWKLRLTGEKYCVTL